MSSNNFADIIAKRPDDAAQLRRLEALQVADYTTNRLFDLVRPTSMARLVVLLDVLVRAGLFERVFRVVSPRGGGLQDFRDFVDVPERLVDVRTGDELEVKPDSIKVVYRPVTPAQSAR